MALLDETNLAAERARHAKFRTNHVGTKLNEAELRDDSFWLDLNLRHPTWNPEDISKQFGIKPSLSFRNGQTLGPLTRKSSFWSGSLWRGVGEDDFTRALLHTLSVIEGASEFIKRFTNSEGEIELVINQQVGIDDGILFKLSLRPFFLASLGGFSVALRVQAWSASPKESTSSP